MELGTLFGSQVELPEDLAAWDLKALPSHGGVWLLTDSLDQPIQLASCQNVRRSVGGRLKRPEERSAKADLTQIAKRIWWQPAYSQFETTYHYWRAARTLYSRSYRKMLRFGPTWFVRIDPTADIPEFTVVKDVYAEGGPVEYLGPFATQRDCGGFIEILQDVFDLCRRYEILRQAPHGRACAYFEMGRCPAPCDGTISLDAYRATVGLALKLAKGNVDESLGPLWAEMGRAASELAFERAATIKKRIDRADELGRKAFGLVRAGEAFRWLIVQRSRGTSWVRPFFVDGGSIRIGDEVRIRNLKTVADGWVEELGKVGEPVADPLVRAEHVWFVSHFLFKQKTAGGVYLRSDELSPDNSWVDCVVERFVRAKPATGGEGDDEGMPEGLKP